MTAEPGMAGDPSVTIPPPVRDPELVLARVHLRLGSLALARAELEAAAGRDALDGDGLLDLVEVRWRTGDLAGAGEAAQLALDGVGDEGPLIALIVAAEAAILRGRPTEARGFAERALAVAGTSLDRTFSGMPRGPVWPADATDMPATAPTLFDTPIAGAAAAAAPARPGAATRAAGFAASGAEPVLEPATIGLWDETAAGAGAVLASATPAATEVSQPPAPVPGGVPAPGVAVPLGPTEGLAAAEAALAAGEPGGAALRLALVLRLDPGLAAAVLAVADGHPGPELALVRGDAYRLLGRDIDARHAFAEAAGGLGPPDTLGRADPHDPSTPEGDPA